MSPLKYLLSFVFKTGLLCGSLLFLYFHLDISSIQAALSTYNPIKALLLSLWFLTSFFLLGIRLYIIDNGKLQLKDAVSAVFLCFFANSIFPARVGEGIKGLYLKFISQKPIRRVFALIFWERFSDLNMLLILVLLLSSLGNTSTYLLPVSLIAMLIWLSLLFVHFQYRNNELKISKMRYTWLKQIALHFSQTPNRSIVIKLFIINLLVWTQFILEMLIAIYWVAEFDLPLSSAMTVFLISSLAFSIPTSPGGIGVYDAAIVFAMGLYGIATGDAMALAILMRTIQYVPTLLIGGTLIFAGGTRLQEIIRPSSAQKMLASMTISQK